MMRPVSRDKFNSLRKPGPNTKEPIAKSVGTYDMARMISKKTKFRVLDVKEVLDEVGPCIFGILLQRKTVDFGGLYIRTSWNRLRFPRFVGFEGPSDDKGYWTFGYYLPKIDMDKQYEMMYAGAKGVCPDSVWERIKAYMPEFVHNPDEAQEYSLNIMAETGQLGKETVIDEDGYTIPIPPRRKKYKWDPDFHPSWIERFRYRMLKRRFLSEYHAMKYSDHPLPFSYVWDSLRASGIFDSAKRKQEFIDEMVIPETDEEEDSYEHGTTSE